MNRHLFAVLAFAWLQAVTPVASAGSSFRPERSGQKESRGLFRQHYLQAASLYRVKRYEDAVKEYQVAYDLRRRPHLLLRISKSYRKLGQAKEAVKFYERYLREEPKLQAGKKPAVEKNMARVLHTLRTGQAAEPPPPALPPGAKESAAFGEGDKLSASKQPEQAVKTPAPGGKDGDEPAPAPLLLSPFIGRPPLTLRAEALALNQVPLIDLGLQDPPAARATAMTLARTRKASKPLYKQWWFWTTLGVVAAGAATTGAVLGTHPWTSADSIGSASTTTTGIVK